MRLRRNKAITKIIRYTLINYGCLMHIDIKNGKIWIQHHGTEVGDANELVELGVPKEDIVLAYHAPYQRQYTGFAVN